MPPSSERNRSTPAAQTRFSSAGSTAITLQYQPIVVQPFSLEFARTPAEEFEELLLGELGAKHIVVGTDFTYGQKRAGTVDSLRARNTASKPWL